MWKRSRFLSPGNVMLWLVLLSSSLHGQKRRGHGSSKETGPKVLPLASESLVTPFAEAVQCRPQIENALWNLASEYQRNTFSAESFVQNLTKRYIKKRFVEAPTAEELRESSSAMSELAQAQSDLATLISTVEKFLQQYVPYGHEQYSPSDRDLVFNHIEAFIQLPVPSSVELIIYQAQNPNDEDPQDFRFSAKRIKSIQNFFQTWKPTRSAEKYTAINSHNDDALRFQKDLSKLHAYRDRLLKAMNHIGAELRKNNTSPTPLVAAEKKEYEVVLAKFFRDLDAAKSNVSTELIRNSAAKLNAALTKENRTQDCYQPSKYTWAQLSGEAQLLRDAAVASVKSLSPLNTPSKLSDTQVAERFVKEMESKHSANDALWNLTSETGNHPHSGDKVFTEITRLVQEREASPPGTETSSAQASHIFEDRKDYSLLKNKEALVLALQQELAAARGRLELSRLDHSYLSKHGPIRKNTCREVEELMQQLQIYANIPATQNTGFDKYNVSAERMSFYLEEELEKNQEVGTERAMLKIAGEHRNFISALYAESNWLDVQGKLNDVKFREKSNLIADKHIGPLLKYNVSDLTRLHEYQGMLREDPHRRCTPAENAETLEKIKRKEEDLRRYLQVVRNHVNPIEDRIEAIAEQQKALANAPTLPEVQKDFAPLQSLLKKTEQARNEKNWTPFLDFSQNKTAPKINLDPDFKRIKDVATTHGLVTAAAPERIGASDEAEALKLQLQNLQTDSLIKSIVESTRKKDISCSHVVTGNKGETSVSAINKSVEDQVGNADLNYQTYAAKTFLRSLCRKDYPKWHSSLKPPQDNVYDALRHSEFYTDVGKLEKEDGYSRYLASTSALLYSLAIRETSGDPRETNSVHRGEFNFDTGMYHGSMSGAFLENSSIDSVLLIVATYLNDINDIRNAQRSGKINVQQAKDRFNEVCFAQYFKNTWDGKDGYGEQAYGKVDPYDTTMNDKDIDLPGCQKIFADWKAPYPPRQFKQNPVLTGCVLKMLTFCPAFSTEYSGTLARSKCTNHGPMNDPDKGMKPACGEMFKELYRQRDYLCPAYQN